VFYIFAFTYILQLKNIRAAVTALYQKSSILSLTMTVKKKNQKTKKIFWDFSLPLSACSSG